MNSRLPNLYCHDLGPPLEDFRAAVIAGLSATPRRLSPKFFYDAKGSALFDQITDLAEYYPTRTEIGLLRHHGNAIADWLGHDGLLIELGSGSETKIGVLLDALQPSAYMPIDISGNHLFESARRIAAGHPTLSVHALCADYTRDFPIPESVAGLAPAVFYPGSSIGNFEPGTARSLLSRVADMLGPGARMLIGVDLEKNVARLEAAYNDAQGVTAEFNLNLLHRIRHTLQAEVEIDAFRHIARYDSTHKRIEMHLVATRPTVIRLGEHAFRFGRGDGIHTENSYKYSVERFQALALEAGWTCSHVWQDDEALFSLHGLTMGPAQAATPSSHRPVGRGGR